MRRLTALALLLGVFFLVSAPVMAQEGGDEDLAPAVLIEQAPETEALADWTYRYVIPTGLALAAIVILMTSIRYFTNVVRKRYRIVEE